MVKPDVAHPSILGCLNPSKKEECKKLCGNGWFTGDLGIATAGASIGDSINSGSGKVCIGLLGIGAGIAFGMTLMTIGNYLAVIHQSYRK